MVVLIQSCAKASGLGQGLMLLLVISLEEEEEEEAFIIMELFSSYNSFVL